MPVPLITANSLLWLSPEADAASGYNTMRRATPFDFTATTTTSATLVSATAFSSADSWSYLGCVVEVLTGPCAGNRRRITVFVPGTDTVTVAPPFSANGAAADPLNTSAYRLWITPEPIMATDSAAADAVTINCDGGTDESGRRGRTETNDYWSDPGNTTASRARFLAVGYGGTNVNYAARITDWVNAGAIATVEATVPALTNTVAGELWIPRLPVRQLGGEFKTPDAAQAYIARRFVKGATDWDGDTGIPGPRGGGTFDLTLELGTLVAASTTGPLPASPPAELHDLLSSVTTYAADAGAMTTAGTPTTTQLQVTSGQQVRSEVGRAMLINGEACFATSFNADGANPDQINVTPSLSAAPATGLTVYTGCNYSPRTATFRSWSGEVYFGGGPGRRNWHGWLPGFKLEGLGAEGEIARLTFSGPYDTHWQDDTSLPTFSTSAGGRLPRWTEVMPKIALAARCCLNVTAGTFTALTIKGFSFDPGLNPQMRKAITGMDGNDGAFMAGLKDEGATGTITIDAESMAQVELFERGAVCEFMLQLGSGAGETAVFYARRIQFTGAPISNADGRWQIELPFKVLASNISATTSGAGSGSVVFPQWVLSFL